MPILLLLFIHVFFLFIWYSSSLSGILPVELQARARELNSQLISAERTHQELLLRRDKEHKEGVGEREGK